MQIAKEGPVSGCISWIIVFGISNAGLSPVDMMIGAFKSVSNFALQTTDEIDNPQPSTVYEIHCIDAMGAVV